MLTPARCLEGFDELKLDEEVKELFLRSNAQRIFKLD